jgi:caffeoyl-CoA O-methyltransferase
MTMIQYAEEHTSPESDLLKKLNRETNAKIIQARMLSGHFQGRLLSMLSCMIRPQYILEIGTFTGYSALCLAEGLTDNGKLITIDVNEELENFVRQYLAASPFNKKIYFSIGNAIEIIPTLRESFDLVFIDADKKSNDVYYEAVLPKVRQGGFILIDNVLWSGKVTQEKIDKDTQVILDFNKKVQQDPRVENVMLPIRDGLTIVKKL